MSHALCGDVLSNDTLISSTTNPTDCVNNHDINGEQFHSNTDHHERTNDGSHSTASQQHASSDHVVQTKLEPGDAGLDERQLNRHDDTVEHSGSPEKKGKIDVNETNRNAHYYRNREKILALAKIRYQENREKLLAYSKQYQSERKDRVKERNDDYYAKNRERLLRDRSEKITCEGCGKTITKGSLSGHLKSKYHLKRVEQNKTINENTQEVSEQVANIAIETI
jgi:hypothetical protein